MSSAISTISPMRPPNRAAISVGQILKLKPGFAREYKRRHDDLWPELSAVMAEAGISMVIYLHENLLFIYATAPSKEAWNHVQNHPITPRWDQHMADILESDQQGRPMVQNLSQMFAFGDLI